MGLQFKKATVHLSHDDVIEAIRQAVESQGYSCGEVVISCSPHQYNGPDTFSATAEVEPKPLPLPTTEHPPGVKSSCEDCGKPIVFDGSRWRHDLLPGDPQPRHPAKPKRFGC
jgi:hypothetical protein